MTLKFKKNKDNTEKQQDSKTAWTNGHNLLTTTTIKISNVNRAVRGRPRMCWMKCIEKDQHRGGISRYSITTGR